MKDNHKLKWLQTHGNLSNLRRFVEKIESDKFEPQKVDDFNGSLTIITADPGMGKSTLLNNLKIEQEKQSGNFLQVIKINLIDYASKLSKEKFYNITQTTEFFKTFLPKVQLEKSAILFDGFDEICPVYERKVINLLMLLKNNVKNILVTSRVNKKIVLENKLGVFSCTLEPFSDEQQKLFLYKFWKANLLDSIKFEIISELSNAIYSSTNWEDIDEICINILEILKVEKLNAHFEKITHLIHLVKDNVKLKDEKLKGKNILEVISTVKDQHTSSNEIKHISKLLMVKEKIKYSSKLLLNMNEKIKNYGKIYADKLITKFTSSVNDEEIKFASIPLQTKMLAESFKDDFERYFCNVSKDEIVFPENFNLSYLYKLYVQKKYEALFKKFSNASSNPVVNEVISRLVKADADDYAKLALTVLFSKKEMESFDTSVSEESKEFLNRVGIITYFDDKFRFIHRTFAEYFVANFFESMLQKSECNSERKAVQNFLIQHIFEDNNSVIRNFFDRHFAESFELHNAVLSKDSKILKQLIKDKKIINVTDKASRTALHLAAAYDNFNAAKLFMENDADVNIKDGIFGWSPLRYADKCGNWKIAETLLEKGANENDLVEAIHLLRNGFKKNKNTMLHIAALQNNVRIMKILLSNTNDEKVIDSRGVNNCTPLHIAFKRNHIKIVKLLLKKGADICAKDKISFTPLHYASKSSLVEIVKFLIKKDTKDIAADFDVKTYEYDTPLKLAASYGRVDIFNALLNSNCEVENFTKLLSDLIIMQWEKLETSEDHFMCGNNLISSLIHERCLSLAHNDSTPTLFTSWQPQGMIVRGYANFCLPYLERGIQYAAKIKHSKAVLHLLCMELDIDVDIGNGIYFLFVGKNFAILTHQYFNPQTQDCIFFYKVYSLSPSHVFDNSFQIVRSEDVNLEEVVYKWLQSSIFYNVDTQTKEVLDLIIRVTEKLYLTDENEKISHKMHIICKDELTSFYIYRQVNQSKIMREFINKLHIVIPWKSVVSKTFDFPSGFPCTPLFS